MTNSEAVNWIINISADIGKAEHRDLWHYEQALSEIREMLESAQPEPCEYTVSAIAVEEMLKDLLPEIGMWVIEGDEAKTAICETVHDALEGLWKLPFVRQNSKELSLTQKALDVPDTNVGDMISRHRLLNDLKELIAAWEKYPVMAEQIKGVETAIGYVKTIPSVTPKSEHDCVLKQFGGCSYDKTGCSDCEIKTKIRAALSTQPEPKTYVEVALSDEYKVAISRHTNPIAWMPLPKPYREEGEE